MTGSELAVRRGRLLVRHLWRSLPARIPPSTGVSVRYVHERCLFYLAIRQLENFLPRMVRAGGALTWNKDAVLSQAKSSIYRKVICDL
jgi:hypothetical protein